MPWSELLGDRWVDLALEAPPPDAVVRAARRLGDAAAARHGGGDVPRGRARSPRRNRCWRGSATPRPTCWRSRGSCGRAHAEMPRRLAAPRPSRVRPPTRRAARSSSRTSVRSSSPAATRAPRPTTLEAGIALAREVHSEALLAACLGRAAALEVAAGRLSRAERAAHSALAVAERRGSAGAAWACAALAAVHWLRGELDQAEARADLGSAAAHGSGDLLAARALRALRGHLAIARGDLAGGCASLATAGLHAEDGAGILPALARRARPAPGGRRRAARRARGGGGRAGRLDRGDPLSALRRVEPLLVPAAAVHPTLRLHCSSRRRRRVAGGRPPDGRVRPARAGARARVGGGLPAAVRARRPRAAAAARAAPHAADGLRPRSRPSSWARSPAPTRPPRSPSR